MLFGYYWIPNHLTARRHALKIIRCSIIHKSKEKLTQLSEYLNLHQQKDPVSFRVVGWQDLVIEVHVEISKMDKFKSEKHFQDPTKDREKRSTQDHRNLKIDNQNKNYYVSSFANSLK